MTLNQNIILNGKLHNIQMFSFERILLKLPSVMVLLSLAVLPLLCPMSCDEAIQQTYAAICTTDYSKLVWLDTNNMGIFLSDNLLGNGAYTIFLYKTTDISVLCI